eukprot:CAMPEP_0203644560 /NCGR_PEP_ID=MMETSP0088-20131115/9993_1 /ASSEMBLY_ACC=CAM_ASM_001087 /TAXON_ID=426623 /ORGANISM="Chaetoceros affinis, Strain CCMP159" /LENGTH=199 /DNA_ID=CAMNT_0050501135 /DNA_START=473 /DNA_END=1072 /DNA_ORIENTATION=+
MNHRRSSLNDDYPVNSVMEITIKPSNEKLTGLVYCTDDISNTIVLKKSVNYTTLASDIWVLNANSVLEKKVIVKEAPTAHSGTEADADVDEGVLELAMPLLNVSRESIEKREKRAIMLAEDSFKHINQKATPEGQVVFDRLLKACNEVVWKGESILVLNQIRVDPPYGSDNCRLIQNAGGDVVLNEGSLERVKRIVGAV